MAQCRDLSVETVPLQTTDQLANGNASPTFPTRPTDGDRPDKAPQKARRSTIERQIESLFLDLS